MPTFSFIILNSISNRLLEYNLTIFWSQTFPYFAFLLLTNDKVLKYLLSCFFVSLTNILIFAVFFSFSKRQLVTDSYRWSLQIKVFCATKTHRQGIHQIKRHIFLNKTRKWLLPITATCLPTYLCVPHKHTPSYPLCYAILSTVLPAIIYPSNKILNWIRYYFPLPTLMEC